MALCALRSSIRVGTLCQDQLRDTERHTEREGIFVKEQIYSALTDTQTIINILLNDIGPIVRREKIKSNLNRLCDTQR